MLQVSLDVDQASSGQGGDRNKCLGITDHLVWAPETVQVLRAPRGDGHEGKGLVRSLNGMTRTHLPLALRPQHVQSPPYASSLQKGVLANNGHVTAILLPLIPPQSSGRGKRGS